MNLNYHNNESLLENVSIFNNSSLYANNISSRCSQNDENFSNIDTLSVQT